MTISDADQRPFGKTGLSAPPIVFRGGVLNNPKHVVPDQTKRIICGEWFRRVAPPVFIDVECDDKRNPGLEQLGRILTRLDVAPDDVVIDIGLKCSAESRSAFDRDAIHTWYDKACKLLGEAYAPRLVTLEVPDENLTSATSAADRTKGLKKTLDALETLAVLKSVIRIAGVGIRCSDWRIAKELCDATELDFITLLGGFTIMRHPPELVEFLADLSIREIPVIATGVFHGGFLVGGPRFEYRLVSPDDSANQSLLAWRKAFTSLCHGHGVRPARACIQFALSAPSVAAVSLSTSHADRVAENIDSVVNHVPEALWVSLKEEGLLEESYSFPG